MAGAHREGIEQTIDKRRVAVVTGAASQLGLEIVGQLLAVGDCVLATDRPGGGVADRRQDPGRCVWLETDLREATAPAAIVEGALDAFGHVDLIVNSAALIQQTTIAEHTRPVWDDIFAVNVRAPFELLQAALPYLCDGAVVVNVISLAAFRYTGPHLAYSASKAALLTLTREAACELAPRGIRVVGVAPGPTRSAMFDDIPADRVQRIATAPPLTGINEPEDVVATILFLASRAARRITGLVVPVTGGVELTILHDES